MIELHDVTKVYGLDASRVEALNRVDLRIDAGEFVSVMGPSGSGKSTLLNLLSALDTPTSGSIVLDGRDIGKLNDDELTLFRRRRIGLVFQFFNLLPTLSAIENVLLPVMLERKITQEDRTRAAALLEEVGLTKRAEHRIHQLSGGELQRVAVARALIHSPQLLLADEPTGNLDSQTSASVLALLKNISRHHGTAIVMVTHDKNAAMVGDRLVSLKDGRVVHDERNLHRAAESSDQYTV